jgi:hypothetical protein
MWTLMIFAQRFGSFERRRITKRHECGQRQRLGRRKKERLIKLWDTGDDNEMVAVREEEKEGEGEEGYAALDRAIIASNMCFFLLLLLSRLLLLSPYTFLGNHFREDVYDTVQFLQPSRKV